MEGIYPAEDLKEIAGPPLRWKKGTNPMFGQQQVPETGSLIDRVRGRRCIFIKIGEKHPEVYGLGKSGRLSRGITGVEHQSNHPRLCC